MSKNVLYFDFVKACSHPFTLQVLGIIGEAMIARNLSMNNVAQLCAMSQQYKYAGRFAYQEREASQQPAAGRRLLDPPSNNTFLRMACGECDRSSKTSHFTFPWKHTCHTIFTEQFKSCHPISLFPGNIPAILSSRNNSRAVIPS